MIRKLSLLFLLLPGFSLHAAYIEEYILDGNPEKNNNADVIFPEDVGNIVCEYARFNTNQELKALSITLNRKELAELLQYYAPIKFIAGIKKNSHAELYTYGAVRFDSGKIGDDYSNELTNAYVKLLYPEKFIQS